MEMATVSELCACCVLVRVCKCVWAICECNVSVTKWNAYPIHIQHTVLHWHLHGAWDHDTCTWLTHTGLSSKSGSRPRMAFCEDAGFADTDRSLRSFTHMSFIWCLIWAAMKQHGQTEQSTWSEATPTCLWRYSWRHHRALVSWRAMTPAFVLVFCFYRPSSRNAWWQARLAETRREVRSANVLTRPRVFF